MEPSVFGRVPFVSLECKALSGRKRNILFNVKELDRVEAIVNSRI